MNVNLDGHIDRQQQIYNNVPMSTQTVPISDFITGILHDKKLLASHLAKELGVSHATVGRWLKGEDIPSPRSCYVLSKFADRPIEEVLRIAGHLPPEGTEKETK